MNTSEIIRNKIYFYLSCCLSMLIFVPGRFAFGLIILTAFNLLIASGPLTLYLLKISGLDGLKILLYPLVLIFITIVYRQIIIIICPVAALTLGLCMYFPTLSAAVFELFFRSTDPKPARDFKLCMKKSLRFTVFALLFFAIRDTAGYGTFTLPVFNDIYTMHLPFDPSSFSAASFLATIPGSLVLVSLIIAFQIITIDKYLKYRKEKKQGNAVGGKEGKNA